MYWKWFILVRTMNWIFIEFTTKLWKVIQNIVDAEAGYKKGWWDDQTDHDILGAAKGEYPQGIDKTVPGVRCMKPTHIPRPNRSVHSHHFIINPRIHALRKDCSSILFLQNNIFSTDKNLKRNFLSLRSHHTHHSCTSITFYLILFFFIIFSNKNFSTTAQK